MGNSVHWYLGTDADDFIFASSRWSTIRTGDGDDTVFANGGRDTVYAGAGNDIIYGGRRQDTLYGEDGNDVLNGGKGRDKLFGGAGADTLSGGNGRDILYGGAGDDILDGGRGNDTLSGCDGFDIAVYAGSIEDYILSQKLDDKWKVTALSSAADRGTDHLSGVEAIYFQKDDKLIYLDGRPTEAEVVADSFETYADHSLVFSLEHLLENDINPDGLGMAITEIDSSSSYGIDLEIVNGQLIYHIDGAFDDLIQDAKIQDQFRYTVVDSSGKTHSGQVTVTVIGVNDAPVIQAASTIEVWENTTHVTDINVRDPEWEEVTVQIADLGDGALFEYDTQKQTLSFIDAPNFEAPGDGNGDNVYSVTLLATDIHGATATKTISVTVNDSTEIAAAPRINEIHYDDVGMDNDEFVEIRVQNGYDVSDLALLLYNGKEGYHSMYNVITAGTFGFELTSSDDTYDYYVWNAPMNGIQNGAPDGFALVEGNEVIEFLSIEGTFVAADGIAQGWMSNDIGVQEFGDTLEGLSLQRQDDDTWIGPIAHTNGYANTLEADMLV